MVKVYAPASSANMSVGFDVLGAAVTPVDGALLGDVVTVEAAETFSLNNLGRFADKLPSEPRENIVYQCWERFCQELGKQIPVAMTLEKNMPIGSGLGSSACSVVAAVNSSLPFLALPETARSDSGAADAVASKREAPKRATAPAPPPSRARRDTALAAMSRK